MGLVDDFKRIVDIFPKIVLPEFTKNKYHHPFSKEWFIDIKRSILEAEDNNPNETFSEFMDNLSNLIEYAPSYKNLVFAEIEISKMWESYEITSNSWDFLFVKSQDKIVDFIKYICYLSRDELKQKDYPFKHKDEKIKLIQSVLNHLGFYRDYRISYEIFGSFYSDKNLDLFTSFLNILESYINARTDKNEKNLQTVKKMTDLIKSETIPGINSTLEKLGKNINGLPKWALGGDIDVLIEKINDTASSIFNSISDKISMPSIKRDIKKNSNLYMSTPILKKLLFILKENYNHIGDFSLSLITFIEKFEKYLSEIGTHDFVSEFTLQTHTVNINHTKLMKTLKEAAYKLLESSEAFAIFANELESGEEFKLCKNWIDPDTKRGEIPIYSKYLSDVNLKISNIETEKKENSNKLQNLNRENDFLKEELEDNEFSQREFKREVEETKVIAMAPPNFLEKTLSIIGIKYLSAKRKESLKKLENLKARLNELDISKKNFQERLDNNSEAIEKIESILKNLDMQEIKLSIKRDEYSEKLRYEKERVNTIKGYASSLRMKSSELCPGLSYNDKNPPWQNGIPILLQDCKHTSDAIISKIREWIRENGGEEYEESIFKYTKIGQKFLTTIVTIQAYGTIYINSYDKSSSTTILRGTNKCRFNFVKSISENINKDREVIADLLAKNQEVSDKIFYSIDC